MKKNPTLFTLLVLFLFFLPFRSVEIPSLLIGLSINFSRLFIVLAILVLFMNVCIDKSYFNKIFNTAKSNPYVSILLIYFLFSILYYYFSLSLGKVVIFGSGDFFFRSWRGRSIGQFLAFLTYGIIPYYLVKKYAGDNSKRKVIEKTLAISIIVLLYYGYFQQISYYLGFPVTGRDLIEGGLPTLSLWGAKILRFYSLAGEPRDFAGFIIGGILFYWYYCYGKITFFSKISILLMGLAFLFTVSTSGYLIFLISAIVIIADMIFLNKIKINKNFIKYALGFSLLIIVLFVLSDTGSALLARTKRYYELFVHHLGNKSSDVSSILKSQSSDLVTIYYLKDIVNRDIVNILFGSGYGNFLTPVYDILKDSFNRNVALIPQLADTRSYMMKILIECGVIGTAIYFLMVLYPLNINKKLIRFYKNNNRNEYYKMLILRYTFIVFFVSGAIHTSFYYFIIMGIIIGKYNSVVFPRSNEHILKS